MDYALVHALGYNTAGIQRVLVFYDINCQYMKNLRRCVMGSKYLSISPNMNLVPSIGIWHVHGHQPECFAQYAPNFIPGAGCVDGEIIETLWNPLNHTASSARSMSWYHRQEYLDAHMGDSNWKKMVKMSMFMLNLRHDACD